MTDRESNQLTLIEQLLEYIYSNCEPKELDLALKLGESLYMQYRKGSPEHCTVEEIKKNARFKFDEIA